MHPMQSPARHPVANRASAQPDGLELRQRQHAVLRLRPPGDLGIRAVRATFRRNSRRNVTLGRGGGRQTPMVARRGARVGRGGYGTVTAELAALPAGGALFAEGADAFCEVLGAEAGLAQIDQLLLD